MKQWTKTIKTRDLYYKLLSPWTFSHPGPKRRTWVEGHRGEPTPDIRITTPVPDSVSVINLRVR